MQVAICFAFSHTCEFSSTFAYQSVDISLVPFSRSGFLEAEKRTVCGGFRYKIAMGIFLDEPKFPVIERNPTASSTISNFNFSDYVRISAITGASLPVGYLAGGSVNIRGPSMYAAGIIGLMGGFMYAYQCSAGRLMGMFPNDDEVARHKR